MRSHVESWYATKSFSALNEVKKKKKKKRKNRNILSCTNGQTTLVSHPQTSALGLANHLNNLLMSNIVFFFFF